MSKYGRSRSPSQGAMNAAAANTTARTPPPAATLAFATVSLHAGQMLRLLTTVPACVEIRLHDQAEHRNHSTDKRRKLARRQPEHNRARSAAVRPQFADSHADG